MRVVLLGTGGSAGVPMIGGADGRGDWGTCDPSEPRNRRTRASIVIESAAGERLLVDTSPDMRAQLLDCAIPRIDAVLYTHAHADHITGIDDVRILNRILGRPLEAFGTEVALAEISARFRYAFRPWKPPGFFRPVLEQRVVRAGEVARMAGMECLLFTQDHGMIESLGLRVGRFVYSTDVVRFDESVFESLAGVDTWVVDCFTQGPPHPTHANLKTVLGWVERLRPRRTILTHMGTDMDWAWMRENLPAGVEPGYDGMVIELAG